jgi:hypothetical protein
VVVRMQVLLCGGTWAWMHSSDQPQPALPRLAAVRHPWQVSHFVAMSDYHNCLQNPHSKHRYNS